MGLNKFIAMGIVILFAMGSKATTGIVYQKDSKRQTVLFNYTHSATSKPDGTIEIKMEFTDLNKNIVVHEEAQRRGLVLQNYTIDHRQTQRKGEVKIDKDEVVFLFEDENHKRKEAREKLSSNFVVGPTLVPYITEHWKDLEKGDNVDIRFGVWDRLETVGFTLKKIGIEKINGTNHTVLEFAPTNFFISKLVDPLIFKFSADGKVLVELIGRVLPKKKSGMQWKDLDAEIVYSL